MPFHLLDFGIAISRFVFSRQENMIRGEAQSPWKSHLFTRIYKSTLFYASTTCSHMAHPSRKMWKKCAHRWICMCECVCVSRIEIFYGILNFRSTTDHSNREIYEILLRKYRWQCGKWLDTEGNGQEIYCSTHFSLSKSMTFSNWIERKNAIF